MITRAPFLTWSLLLGEEFRPPLSTEKRSKGLNSSLRGQIKRRGKIGRGLNIHIRKNTIYVGHSYFTAALEVVVHHRISDEGNWAYLNFAYVEIGQVKYCDFSCVPFLELAGSFKMAKTFYDLTFFKTENFVLWKKSEDVTIPTEQTNLYDNGISVTSMEDQTAGKTVPRRPADKMGFVGSY